MLENPQTGQYFSYVVKLDPGGTASYNGLLISIQRRAAQGVTVNANYTLSHCISDWWNTTANSGSGNTGFTNPDNRRFDRGNCTSSATDRRHIFNLSAVAEAPTFNNSILRGIGSNWRISPILKILSGSFMSSRKYKDDADPEFGHGETIHFTTLEPAVMFPLLWKQSGWRLDYGFGAGVYWFSSEGFESFNGAFLEPLRFDVYFPIRKGWVNAVVFRAGALVFPAGFNPDAFAARGGSDNRIASELVPTYSLFVDLTPVARSWTEKMGMRWVSQ